MASNAKKKKHVCSNSIQQKNALLRFTLLKMGFDRSISRTSLYRTKKIVSREFEIVGLVKNIHA